MLPKRRFGRSNKPFGKSFRRTFRRFLTQIEYSRPWKVIRNNASKGLLLNLCSPNEDFGPSNKPFGEYFRTFFQRVVAQIRYSRPWTVLRKDTTDLLFCLPNSSFGEHKIARSSKIFGRPHDIVWKYYRENLLYKTTITQDALMIIWCFLCNNNHTRCIDDRLMFSL